MADRVRIIGATIQEGELPGAPQGKIPAVPGVSVAISADALQEYVAGGAGGSGQWYQNLIKALPWSLDDVTRDFGDDLYDRMLYDSQVSSAMSILRASILEDGLHFNPAIDENDDPDYAMAVTLCEGAQAMLDDDVFRTPLSDVLWDMTRAIAVGNRVAELVWDFGPGAQGKGTALNLVAMVVKPRHALAFVCDAFYHVLGFLARIPGVAVSPMQSSYLDPSQVPNMLPREKFAVLTFRPETADPRGTSLLRAAYTPWNLKQQVLREWVRFLTQFASPSLIGVTPEHARTAAKLDSDGNPIIDPATGLPMLAVDPEQSLIATLTRFKNGTALAVPFGTDVKVIQSQGEGRSFIEFIDDMDRQITKSVLGQTLATEEGKHQTRAASAVHQDILDTEVRQAKQMLCRMLRRDVLRPWALYNYGPRALPLLPTASLGATEQPDMVQMMVAVAQLKTADYIAPSQLTAIDTLIGLPQRTADEVAQATQAALAPPPVPVPFPGPKGGAPDAPGSPNKGSPPSPRKGAAA